MTCPVVLQVFFDGDEELAPLSDDDLPRLEMYGQKLWQADVEGPPFRWSIDYITCTDERWTVFGPYETSTEARSSFRMMEARGAQVLGFRIINKHCAVSVLGGGCRSWTKDGGWFEPKLPRHAWTDG